MGINLRRLLLFSLLVAACQPALNRQPKLKPYAVGSARIPVPGTRPFAKKTFVPEKISLQILQKGQQRYDIYCTVCHGWTGHGDGLLTQRGFPKPVSFHEPAFREMPLDFFIEIIIQGGANMPSYAAELTAEERWAVANYIKALQLSENFPEKYLNAKDRALLNKEAP